MSNDPTDILEAALDQSFAHIPVAEAEPAAPASVETPAPATSETSTHIPLASPSSPSATNVNSESWKEEYEANLSTWRAQSAEAREKAEQERAKWEARRKEEAAARKAAGLPEEAPALWETSGLAKVDEETFKLEKQASDAPEPTETPPDFDSQKWEEIPSAMTSSHPSLDFPDLIDTPPVGPTEHTKTQQQPPKSVTLAIFDSSLSTRTRVLAFASALTVNLLLPFVNGVMLGFGEIFAKNVVMGWLGWSAPAANVGLRSSRAKRN